MLRTRVQRDPENAGGGGGENDVVEQDDDSGDDESEDDEEEKGEEKSSGEKTVPEAKYLQIKNQLAQADRKKQEALNELNALKTKDLPEADKLKAEKEAAEQQAATYKTRFEKTARTNAFLKASGDLKLAWVNTDTALRIAELDDLEINEDGSVDGIKDAVKALAKDHPYLLAPQNSTSTTGTGATKSGSVVGSKNTGKKPEGEYTKEDLLKRMPSLGR